MATASPRFVRIPSLLEQMYLDGAKLGYNFAPRAYVKIDRSPVRSTLEDALSRLTDALPHLNICYQGAAWRRALTPCQFHWIESDCNDVMQVQIPAINWRKHTMSLSVIYLKQTQEWYLCFSLFHGAGDGYTLTNLMYAFFAALNKELTEDYDFSMDEHDFPDHSGQKSITIPIKPACSPIKSGRPHRLFRIARTEGAPYLPTSLLCRPLSALVSAKKAVMVIPVNMRRYCQPGNKIRMGNLVSLLFLDTAGKTVNQLRAEIRTHATQADLPIFKRAATRLYRAIPGGLRRLIFRSYAVKIRRSGKTPMVALVSNVGKVLPSALRSKDFHAEDCWFSFENLPLFAVTLITSSFGDHTNTCISTHYSSISEDTIQRFANQVSAMDVQSALR